MCAELVDQTTVQGVLTSIRPAPSHDRHSVLVVGDHPSVGNAGIVPALVAPRKPASSRAVPAQDYSLTFTSKGISVPRNADSRVGRTSPGGDTDERISVHREGVGLSDAGTTQIGGELWIAAFRAKGG